MKHILFILLLTTPALTQDNQFWTRQTIALVAVDGAVKGVDAYFTHRVIEGISVHNRCYVDASGVKQCPITWNIRGSEGNPLAAPFVKTTAGQVGYFSASVAGDIGFAYLLHKTNHERLARAVLYSGVGMSATCAGRSAYVSYSF